MSASSPVKAYTPGKTYFDNPDKKSFADVPIERDNNNAIPTQPFLDASESVIGLFDVLGSSAFSLVKKDMTGNIKKIRDRHLESPLESDTLQNLSLNEIKGGKKTASEGLTWLVRGFDFTAQALRRSIADPNEELAKSFASAYEGSLKEWHNWFVRKAFGVAMSATPYRKDFYAKLGEDENVVAEAQEQWLKSLEEQVDILKAFQKTPEADWEKKKLK